MKKYLKKIKFINDAYTKFKWRERRVSYGTENPDKTFYVVRRAGSKVGLFSLVLTSLGYIEYAVDHGYIPVIDMSNEDNTYMQQDRKGNVWEYYFEQPCGYTLDDIRHSSHVIIGNGIIDGHVPFPGENIAYNEEELKKWRTVADRYLIVRPEIRQEADELWKRLAGRERVLGVLLRGTDYVNSRPKNHPVQPTIEQAINKIDEVLAKQEFSKIYLATEDAGIYQELCNRYGEKIVSMDVKRYITDKTENINEISVNKSTNKYQMGKDYLINILLLSKCDYLLAGNAGGSQGALLFRDKDAPKFLFNLGKY